MDTAELLLISKARMYAADGRAAEIRREKKLSVRDIANSIGVPPSTVSRWERGLTVPRGASAIRYIELLTTLAGIEPQQKIPISGATFFVQAMPDDYDDDWLTGSA